MFLRSSQFSLLAMIASCFSSYYASAQQVEGIQSHGLHSVDARSCFFADEEARFVYTATARPIANEERIPWNVEWSLATTHRTLQRGSSQTKVVAGTSPLRYAVEIPMPELRDGVTLPIQLSMRWSAGQATHQQTRQVQLYAREAFTHRQTLLENAQIALFDPEGQTVNVLEEHDIPYTRLLDLAALDLVTEGVLLVGEGVSLREQRKLGDSLIQAAQRGVSVLCLAPLDGNFPFATFRDDQSVQPTKLSFEREEIVRRYDKRFDVLPSASHLSLKAHRSQIALNVTENQADWPWLEMQFPAQKPGLPPGRLVVCGLSLVAQWEKSPVPRYLFLRLLEEFTATQPILEKSDEFIQR